MEKETLSDHDFSIDRQAEYSDDVAVKLITSYHDWFTSALEFFSFSWDYLKG